MKDPRAYRRTPYTAVGIKRVPCARCGAPSAFQWNVCALPGFHGLCLACDVALNRTVLAFMRVPDAERIGDEYERTKSA